MTYKSFVQEDYEIKLDNQGFLVFPDDRRNHPISPQVKKIRHPSKNNLYMLESLCDYLGGNKGLGDHHGTILDPMAGAGSIMAGRDYCSRMIMIELGPHFSDEIIKNIIELQADHVMLLPETDCVDGMKKLGDDSIRTTIFSPPYANQLQNRNGSKIYDDKENWVGEAIRNYAYANRRNMANMAQFSFNRVMRGFYKELFRITEPGGTVCLIIKDRMMNRKRVGYGVEQVRWASQAGFKPEEWCQRVAKGSVFGIWNMDHGTEQVMDEHIIIMGKKNV